MNPYVCSVQDLFQCRCYISVDHAYSKLSNFTSRLDNGYSRTSCDASRIMSFQPWIKLLLCDWLLHDFDYLLPFVIHCLVSQKVSSRYQRSPTAATVPWWFECWTGCTARLYQSLDSGSSLCYCPMALDFVGFWTPPS
eukprot:scaffold75535_cov35-Cyclotella_meneghiniana.AAC.1